MRLLCSAPNIPCPACCAIYLGADALISVCSALSYESAWSLWVWPCWADTKWGSCLLWCIKAELCLSSGSEKLLIEDSRADFVLVLVRHNLCLEKSYFYAASNGIFHHFIVSYVLLAYGLNITWNNWVWINNFLAASSSYKCRIIVNHIFWKQQAKTIHDEHL